MKMRGRRERKREKRREERGRRKEGGKRSRKEERGGRNDIFHESDEKKGSDLLMTEKLNEASSLCSPGSLLLTVQV